MISARMKVHSTAIIHDGAKIGAATIGPHCIVGPDVVLSDDVILASHVVIEGATSIGARTKVHAFSVLGSAPQHLGYKGEDTRLIIGEDNTIREHVTMNRGTAAGGGTTLVGDGGYFMTGAHIAHDCLVGNHVIFANNATLGGHVVVGDRAFLGGLCAVHQHCRIGEFAFVGGCAAVTNDVIPYASAVGNHANLVGLNIIGLKRRGILRDAIHDLRAAYRLLFEGEGTFSERIEQVRSAYGKRPEVSRILDFIDAGEARPIMTPARSV